MSQVVWSPPQSNEWKLNIDASWNLGKNCERADWVVRDSLGSPIYVGLQTIAHE